MERFWCVSVFTAVLFLGMILLLAAKPKYFGKLTGSFIVIAAVSGFLLYGYGYTATLGDIPMAIVRSLLSVCGMFVGRMDYGNISAAPMFSNRWILIYYWVVHLLALYATASATIATIGGEALRKLRLWLARWGNLHLIFGIHEDAVELGKGLLKKGGSVVFVGSEGATQFASTIAGAGCVLRSDPDALAASVRFLKGIGVRPGKRKIEVYCLHPDSHRDAAFASAFLDSLQKLGVAPEQTSLILPGAQDDTFNQYQAQEDRYGYGFVTVFQPSGLAARLLMQQYPPCKTMSFDENCRATEDFHAMIIGFGQMGQSVLRSLIMNGQFVGSRFRVTVFAPDYQAVSGYFSTNFKTILDHYDITFQECDARSSRMYEFLSREGKNLKYVALCAGDRKANQEIAEDLMHYFAHMGLDVPIYLCSYQGIQHAQKYQSFRVYTPEVLSMETSDRMAMTVNHVYCNTPDRTALQTWMNCDYFSRMSSRASADFIPAMLFAAGKTAEEVETGSWELTQTQLENLSKTEHLRWCAFHYCMGFSPMPPEVYDQRAQQYREEVAKEGTSSLRIGKDIPGRQHACLIDWEALDELSEKERSITGKKVDYKALDRQTVLQIPQFLRSASDKEGRS